MPFRRNDRHLNCGRQLIVATEPSPYTFAEYFLPTSEDATMER